MLLQTLLAFRPSNNDLVFAIKTFLAAMLALFIAISLNLQNPMWAMGTVFIVANPLAGVLSSKAVYRMLGTLAGACLSILVLPPFINSPLPFSLIIALWVGFCLYVSLLDRTPRSYFFMLAGYTMAMIGFSAVADPTHLFDISLSRFEEITLGILCATVISRVFFPVNIAGVLSGRIDKWFSDIESNFKDCLAGHSSPETIVKEAQRFAADSTEIHALAIHLSYENSALRRQTRSVQALQHQMILLVPALVALADRVHTLKESLPNFDNLLMQVQQQTEQFIAGTPPENQTELSFIPPSILQKFEQMLAIADTREKLMIMSAREAFIFFIQHFQTLRLIWQCVKTGQRLPDFIEQNGLSDQRLHRGLYRGLHRDHGVALRGAVSAFLAIGIVCFLWHMSGWQYGFMAAQITAVCACILTFLDNPVPALASFRLASIYSALVVFIYQFAIFPVVHDFFTLMLVLFPFFLIFTSMLPYPALTGFALPILINTAMGLNIRNLNEPVFGAYIDNSLAIVLGILIPSFTLALIRSTTPELSVQRLVRLQWRDVQQIIEKPVVHPWAYYMRRLLDRIGLMAPRVLRAPAIQADISQSIVELAGATNIIRLKRTLDRLPEPCSQQVSQLLQQIWNWYDARLSNQDFDTAQLLMQIDQLISQVLLQPSSMLRDQVLVALTGVRRSLFQHAGYYVVPSEPIPALGETYGWRG
ncbi:FUSC family protein [Alkanindiges illinoisensis]|uniref:FUSC family protein n=1 Tax=Alkanindiges illinoisensis TaxID=197183 RepID=UPI00047B6B0E|nr:FUSC family protein [Alkanindiges illinoisensis]